MRCKQKNIISFQKKFIFKNWMKELKVVVREEKVVAMIMKRKNWENFWRETKNKN